jgi:hypothetical protein
MSSRRKYRLLCVEQTSGAPRRLCVSEGAVYGHIEVRVTCKDGASMKKQTLAAIVLAASLLAASIGVAGCGLQQSNVIIDWVNFIRFGGITYLANYHPGRELQQADLGAQFDTVRASLANNVHDPNYQARDGEAAYLAVGTPVYRVLGYAPTFRLAARQSGKIVLYEADTNPHAKTGANLLDIGGKVRSIAVFDDSGTATVPLATIADAHLVATLTTQLLAAPVDQSRLNSAGTQYMLTFHLADGTDVVRAYFPEAHDVQRGIVVPDAFVTAIASAISNK